LLDDPNPTVLDSLDAVDKTLVKELGPYYRGGREHVVKDFFDAFLETAKPIQYAILEGVWEHLQELWGGRNRHPEKAMAIARKKLRFLEFCMWFSYQREEDSMVEKIINEITYPIVPDLLEFLRILKVHCISTEKHEEGKGKEKEKEKEEEEGTLAVQVLDWFYLTPSTVVFFYHRTLDRNWVCLESFLERYIKNYWLDAVESPAWERFIPRDRREMLEAEQHCDMLKYYQKSAEESSRLSTTEEIMEWNEFEEEEEEWNFGDDEEEWGFGEEEREADQVCQEGF
jgi:hypothetical protein